MCAPRMSMLHRWFLTKEALYPFTSGATGLAGACNQTRITGTPRGDKVQLVGTGFRQLRQWSATALKEVRPCHLASLPCKLCV